MTPAAVAAAIAALTIADPPEVWSGLGFAVDAGCASVGGVEAVLVGHDAGGRGVTGWSLAGLPLPPEDGTLDGLPTRIVDAGPTDQRSPAHPNGVLTIDHVVVVTPDLPRTIGALEHVGLELRRTRDSGTYGSPMRQAFFKLGPVVLEVVGPAEPTTDPKFAGRPAAFFGLAFTVADLDATAAHLGERLHPAKDAVQPGRRIATLDKGAGSTVPIAFMSPGAVDY